MNMMVIIMNRRMHLNLNVYVIVISFLLIFFIFLAYCMSASLIKLLCFCHELRNSEETPGNVPAYETIRQMIIALIRG